MLRRELDYFFAALRFFTRVPAPAWVGYSAQQQDHATRYLPLIGLLVGGIGAAVTVLTAQVLPLAIAVVLGMLATVRVTGAFHEDGFADSCDGFGGGWEKARVLAIMKDSRIGSYGVIGMVLLLLLKWNALLQLPALPAGGRFAALPLATLALGLIAAHGVSRFACVVVMQTLDYARDEASSKSHALARRMGAAELVFAAICGVLPCLWLPPAPVAVALGAVALVTLLAVRYFRRRLGGYTGDCLGATQQVSEVVFYLGLLCSFT